MTPAEWTVLSRRHWREFYPIVHAHAKVILDALPSYETLSLNELVERIFPERDAQGEGIDARKRIYSGLRAAIKLDVMDGYHQPGPGRRFQGATIYPHVWHGFNEAVVPKREVPAPAEVECPCCGTKFAPGN